MERHETGMDDMERQAVHGDREILEKKNKAQIGRCTWCVAGTVAVVLTLCMVPAVLLHQEVHYYVAIDSVSGGLDPMEGLSFNLTLGVASWSYGAKACLEPGAYAEVSYRGVELAASEAETGRLCVGPNKSAEQRVVAARVAGRRVPDGRVLDSLAAEMKQGVAAFDVALHLPAGSYGMLGYDYDGEKIVSPCGKRRVGAATAWCDAPDQMPKLN
ncbi:unnamed protein product [Alopecurus aequalis]